MVAQAKKIWVISPQSWGKMLLAKHHYAIELAKAGYTVYFINPPHQQGEWEGADVQTEALNEWRGLYLVTHKLFFSYKLKFHARGLFDFLMKWQIRKIIQKAGRPDIVWSFDLGNLIPLHAFSKQSLKIFHPIDEPGDKIAIAAARGANIIFSVTHEILQKYQQFNVPKYFINHGLADEFTKSRSSSIRQNHKIQIGFSGNLLRPDIDRKFFLNIIHQNPDIQFNCWGAYRMEESNIGGNEDQSTMAFIQELQKAPNLILHGVLSKRELALAYMNMDAFLICYDIEKDQSNGTNYHKIMEFLSTGKVIIANNITTYKNRPHLIAMTQERDSNNELPKLFKKIISNLDFYNNELYRKERVEFANNNTYTKQIALALDYCKPLLKN